MKNLVFIVLGCLLALLLLAGEVEAAEPSAGAARESISFVVVIGNNKSLGRRRPDLHYADDDAARYYEIFQAMAPGRVSLLSDFDRDTQRLFPAARALSVPPTRRALEAVGRALARQVQAARQAGHETELYFVFAGHGDVADGEGFIELSDSRFRSSELKQWLRAIPFTRAHVILDSCNSFFMLGVRKPGGRHFATSEDAARAMAERLPNVGVFLSTSAEGEAFEWSEIQSGIFSHLVRSGLLGAADANGDGAVSYLELAAFVDTATADVKNPNMRPHVFARGPGAREQAPIARLQSMSGVRRFALGDSGALRIRIRDAHGVPLLDAHSEQLAPLGVALPEAWAQGAVVERLRAGSFGYQPSELFLVPEGAEQVTVAALEPTTPRGAVRGPDEAFQSLFAQPFGPSALARYSERQRDKPPPVYGVSQEDTKRMELVLEQLARTGRTKRLSEALGGTGFGLLMLGAGAGVLSYDSNASASDKREARIGGGVLLGLGGLFVVGGVGSLFSRSTSEHAAEDFRRVTRESGDTAQAFAAADKRLQLLIRERRAERWAGGIIGGLVMAGTATAFTWSELSAPDGSDRLAPRLGWGGGFLGGALMLSSAVLEEEPADILTKIWRDDPSLNQYQPQLMLTKGGVFASLVGTL